PRSLVHPRRSPFVTIPILGACVLTWACAGAPSPKSPDTEQAAPGQGATPVGVELAAKDSQVMAVQTQSQPHAPTSSDLDITPKPPPTTEALVPLFGQQAPTALVAAAPGGHWAVVCEAVTDADGDGKLAVRL